MACQMCNGFEHFVEQPQESKESKESCSKDVTNCMYTAQGMFVCNTKNDSKERDVAQNLEMLKESFRMEKVFNSAGQWQN